MKKLKNFWLEYWSLIVMCIFWFVFFYLPLPYVVSGTGGLISMKNRFSINGDTIDNYSMAYVSSLNGTPATLLYGFIKKDYDIEKLSINEQKLEDHVGKIMLGSSSNFSVMCAYNKALKTVNYKEVYFEVVQLDSRAVTDIEIGDKITGIDDVIFNDYNNLMDELGTLLNDKNEGDKVNFKVKHDDKIVDKYATLYKNEEGILAVGLSGVISFSIDTDPEIKFDFSKKEAGPSGGFMLALAIYDVLVDEDVSNGLKIAGTGTIDADGNVGPIGGVKYKIRGAKKEDIDVFFIPIENYDEANDVCVKENCKFDLVKVSTFDEALEYLKSYD